MKRMITLALAASLVGTTAYAAEKREKVQAIPIHQEVVFDGHSEMMQCYNIDGYTYFRLRDVAEQVSSCIFDYSNNFDIKYDAAENSIDIIRTSTYRPIPGVEKYVIGSEPKEAVRANTLIKVNGSLLPSDYIKGYVIDGYTFYKLRDFVTKCLTLDIAWCEEEKVIEVTSPQNRDPVYDENGNPIVYRKPVIYLYPEETTEVSVEVDCPLTVTYPTYNEGWTVTAEPDGTLTNHADGREYSYLFWEGEGYGEMDFSDGFVVKGEDTVSFLQDKLSEMGMTPREYNEFIVYWLPYMQDNPYNLISFQWDNYAESAKLNITPEPDNMLRVFMAFKALDEPVEVPEQELSVLNREGFTVVEWGGTEVK